MFCSFQKVASAQSIAVVSVVDKDFNPISDVKISIDSIAYFTNKEGNVIVKLTAGRHKTSQMLDSFYLGWKGFNISGIPNDTTFVYLEGKTSAIDAVRLSTNPGNGDFNRINLKFLPGIGNSSDIIKLMPGVFSQSELTSQYNVRGGNYDENLVYVNDIEIFRPQLVRTGQQEGLGFINTDMISNIAFYPGGFEASYGDKLSSVLDVKYLKPDSFVGSVSMGLLGINAFVADKPNKKFTYVFGARYRSNNYILNTLDVKGQYKPVFYDFQTLLTFTPNHKWQIEYLGNLGINDFSFSPVAQKTKFGTISRALELNVRYAGLEQMNYINATNALSVTYKIDAENELKFINSLYNSLENEYYTVRGAYDLGELDNNLGSDNFGQRTQTIGDGYFINHARNDLESYVNSTSLIGKHRNRITKIKTEWKLNYKQEHFDDRVLEWKYSDSAEINVAPFPQNDDTLHINSYLRTNAIIQNNQLAGSVQKIIPVLNKLGGILNVGVRGTYRSLGNQFFWSPRFRFSFNPFAKRNKDKPDSMQRKLQVNINGGYYYQPAYYREMRDLQGVLNTNIKPQKSIHFTAGIEYYFKIWDRKFKYSGDLYYKDLKNIIPYAIDNVRIRYFAINNGNGYAAGFDNRIYGEFIKGMESWFNLALLSTKEQFTYQDSGITKTTEWLRRPTDARVVSSIFFQDDLPSNKTFRMSMMLTFASGVPFYFLESNRYAQTGNRIPAYQRVDIGFQKLLIMPGMESKRRLFKNIETAFISVDVFNLLANNNIISYNIFKDFANNYYGVPNYLTGRRLNLRLYIGF